jgi:hypothetical protein
MKVIVFLVALAFFVGSFLLFGYAFSVSEAWAGPVFFDLARNPLPRARAHGLTRATRGGDGSEPPS